MPLSLTEKSFVEDNIFLKKVPRVAIVVTRLDQINEKERLDVYNYIKTEVDKWGKDIPVWVSGHNIKKFENGVVCGSAEILVNIAKISQSSDNEQLRYQQVETQINSIAELYFKILSEQREIFKLSKNDYAKKLDKEKTAITGQDLLWEDIVIEIEKRKIDFSIWMTKTLHEKEPGIKEDILGTLKNYPNPKKWWEEIFPSLLKKKLQGLTKDINSVIQGKTATDCEQILHFTKQKLNWEVSFNGNKLINKEIEALPYQSKKDVEGKDLSVLNEYMVGITSVATVTAFMLVGPFGMFVGAAGGVIGKRLIKGKIDRQRLQAERYVEEVLSKIFEHLAEEISKQVAKTYLSIATHIRRQEEIWHTSIIKTLENIDSSDVAQQLNEIDLKIKKLLELNETV